MKTQRIPKEAGFCEPSRLPKGPNGRALCRWCSTEVPAGRRSFCGPDCVHEWKCHTNPAYQARQVLERDLGVCETCGLDCLALMLELKHLRAEAKRAAYGPEGNWWRDRLSPDADTPFGRRCRELELPPYLQCLSRRLWEMDHRIPVAEGGGGCGLENLRTLCWKCHRRVTRELAARRAVARRRAKEEPPSRGSSADSQPEKTRKRPHSSTAKTSNEGKNASGSGRTSRRGSK